MQPIQQNAIQYGTDSQKVKRIGKIFKESSNGLKNRTRKVKSMKTTKMAETAETAETSNPIIGSKDRAKISDQKTLKQINLIKFINKY